MSNWGVDDSASNPRCSGSFLRLVLSRGTNVPNGLCFGYAERWQMHTWLHTDERSIKNNLSLIKDISIKDIVKDTPVDNFFK